MWPVRWLTGRIYGRPDLPRRVTWLLVFTGYVLVLNAVIGLHTGGGQ